MDESVIGLIVGAVISLVCVVWGIVLYSGRGAMLIAGYNSMSDDERAGWDEKRLCRSTGKLMVVTGAWTFAVGLACYLEAGWVATASIPVFLIGVIIWVVYINKSHKFRK